MALETLILSVGDTSNASFGPISISQKEGVDDTAVATFNFTAPSAGWTIYLRFTSTLQEGDGKQEVNLTGGFPRQEPAVQGTGTYTIESNSNLVVGTSYDVVAYAVAPDYLGNHWEGAAGEVFPTGNSVVVSETSLTISGQVNTPTSISGNLSVQTNAAEGVVIGALQSDAIAVQFSEVSPTVAWADIAADGTVSVAAGQTAPASIGTVSIGVQADNSASGGGTYSDTLTINVVETTTATVAMPAHNVTASSLSELYTIVQAFENNFSNARSTYSVPSGEVVIGLDVNTSATLNLANYDLAERVTIRGTGTISRNDFYPTSTTQVGDFSLRNSSNIRLMALQMNAVSNAGWGDLINCDDCSVERCVLNAKAATSVAELAQSNQVGNGIYFYNSARLGIRDCAIVGGSFQLINGTQAQTSGSNTSDMEITWNVFDQVRGDHLRIQGGTNNGFTISHNLMGGRIRNPFADHSDAKQIGAGQTTTFSNAVVEYNCQDAGISYGNDSHPPVQMWWFGGGSASSRENIFRQNFNSAPGRMLNASGVGNAGSSATFNTDFAISDMPEAQETSRYSASFACYIALPGGGVISNNIVARVNSGAGNTGGQNGGIHVDCPDSDDSDNAPAGAWDPQTAFVTRELKRSETIGALAPPSSAVQSHYDHPNPKGAYLLLKDMFDASAPNHWKNRGWPVDAMCHVAYDPLNELAGAAGSYTVYNSVTGANIS